MREFPEPNYFVDLHDAELTVELERYLPESYAIRVNQFVWIYVLPWFPIAAWPSELPLEPEEVTNRSEAAWYAARMAHVIVAPEEDGTETRPDVMREDVDGMGVSVFRIMREAHRRLVDEIAERLHRDCRRPDGRDTRLSEIQAGELRSLLVERLPDARLSEYKRTILCLP